MNYKTDGNVTYNPDEIERQSSAIKNQISNYRQSCQSLMNKFEKIRELLGNGSQYSQASNSIKEFYDVYDTIHAKISDKFDKLAKHMDEWVRATRELEGIYAKKVQANTESMKSGN